MSEAMEPNSERIALECRDLHKHLGEGEMRVMIPYAGVFCAFTNPEVEDIAAVQLVVFTMPELPRDDPPKYLAPLCFCNGPP